jgi:hypothetical protein
MGGQTETAVKDNNVGEEEVGEIGEDEKHLYQIEVLAIFLVGIARACGSCVLELNTCPCCQHNAFYTWC